MTGNLIIMVQASSQIWNEWLNQFKVAEVKDSPVEIMDFIELESFEDSHNLKLPKEYKEFCLSFGTSAFFNALRVYCPNQALSEDLLFSTQEELESYKEYASRIDAIDDMLDTVERMLLGTGLVFAEGRAAIMYIFDTASYKESDNSCDIWSASAEGALDSFAYLGRSFYEFFLRFCVEVSESDSENSALIRNLPQEKKLLIRFNSDKPLGVF